jgi:hypothetical protein
MFQVFASHAWDASHHAVYLFIPDIATSYTRSGFARRSKMKAPSTRGEISRRNQHSIVTLPTMSKPCGNLVLLFCKNDQHKSLYCNGLSAKFSAMNPFSAVSGFSVGF